MKNKPADYSDFYDAIRKDELVYLFGTGISAALTGKDYSWKKWILDGTEYFADSVSAENIRTSIKRDSSTTNLLKNVATVLEVTKREGTYPKWMQASFEGQEIVNDSLKETLRKLLVTQDVLATTNYDLLLERATGLPALSYEETNQAFLMLDSRRSEAVLHIHGLYDSANRADNIVADGEQYDAILLNGGAQFIQQLLGTRTLIFVGCGQTTEDANVARFIRFANEELHIQRNYYFLYKEGEKPAGLPPFIKAVSYGDEYDDLTCFLEDVVQARLQAKIESNPMILRTAYTHAGQDAYGLAEYHYSRQCLAFCGRKVELARLRNFLEADRRFLWWAITGQAGAGKSRLALEFMQESADCFFGFFLNCAVETEWVKGFQPFRDTAVIVDYVRGNERRIADIMAVLLDKFSVLPYKLRILFVERENTTQFGSWYHTLSTALGTYYRMQLNAGEYNLELSTRRHRFLYLDDLDEAAVEALIGSICEKGLLPEDAYRNRRLRQEYAAKFEQLKYRPLFIQMYVEAWIGNGCLAVEYNHYKDLLSNVVNREQERILMLVDGDAEVFNALIRVIILSGITDGICLADISKRYPKEWNVIYTFVKTRSVSGVQRTDFVTGFLKDVAQDVLTGTERLNVLYPDIIKEYMFLHYLDVQDMKEVSKDLWGAAPTEYNAFLDRCLTDFQHEDVLAELIREESADYTNGNAMLVRQSLLAFKIITSKEEGRYFLQRDLEEYEYWKQAPVAEERAWICLQGLYLSVRQLFGWSRKEALEAIELLAAYGGAGEQDATKVKYLLEFVHYLVEKNCMESAEKVMEQAGTVLDRLPETEEKEELYLSLQRESMVLDVYYKRWDVIGKNCGELRRKIKCENERQSELYAYIMFSGAVECKNTMQWKGEELLLFTDALQDYAEAYGSGQSGIYFNDKVHYYYLHAKLISTETLAICSFMGGVGSLALRWIDELLEEIESNMMISDFAGLLAGAEALKVGFDASVTDEQTAEYLERVDALLERYPDNELLAAKAIELWETAYTEQYKATIPRKTVDRAYTLLLRFPKSREVEESFFGMLKESGETGRWFEYTGNKAVVCGLQENNLFEYLMPPTGKAVTVTRAHPKVGANDPCPCGSGRKFKKCCKGKGRYD